MCLAGGERGTAWNEVVREMPPTNEGPLWDLFYRIHDFIDQNIYFEVCPKNTIDSFFLTSFFSLGGNTYATVDITPCQVPGSGIYGMI